MKPDAEVLPSLDVPAPPPAARQAFGDSLDAAQAYAALLATEGVRRGLLGPREVPRLWDRHLLNCAVVAPLLPHGAEVCDVGSGAGLPGVVLALARPDLRMTLLEPLQRRAAFLAEVVESLALADVRVVRGRAEDQAGRTAYDVVVARAVAPLRRLAPWTLPLLGLGGELLALKGRTALQELEDAAAELARLGAQDWSVEEVGAGIVDPPTTVVRVRRGPSGRPPGRPSSRRRGGR